MFFNFIYDFCLNNFDFSKKCFVEHPRLNKQEVVALLARFKRIAPDRKLLAEQFRQTMGMLGLIDNDYLPLRMFAVFDHKKQGYLDVYDFISNIAVMLRGSDAEKINLSFHIANVSESGGISQKEFLGDKHL